MLASKPWDIEFVRSQFPALSQGKYSDTDFFENAGGTYVPHQVIKKLDEYLVSTKVQPYGVYASSEEGTQNIELATVKMAEMINADEDEVVIGHCTTMNLYILAMSLRKIFKQGDEIIVSEQDHESNISPWLRLQEFGVTVKFWPIDPITGRLSLEQLEYLLSTKTRLVCVTHSSNIVGDVNPIKKIADAVHKNDSLLLVDGVSYAPHHAIDVKGLGVDIYVLSLYKLFGPHLGLMYVKRTLHEQLENQYFSQLPELYQQYQKPGSPNYLRIALNPGLVNHEEVASLLGLVQYFNELYQHHFSSNECSFFEKTKAVMELSLTHETTLSEYWFNWLVKQKKFTLIGNINNDVNQRSPTFSLKINHHSLLPKEAAKLLAKKNIAVQSGSFYAWRCLNALNIGDEGVLRVSFAHFNNLDEVRRLCNALDEILT